MRSQLKKALNWAGGAFSIAGIIFVILRLRDYGGELDGSRFGSGAWVVLAALALVYGLANVMLGLAWWNLLQKFGCNITQRWAVKTYGVSQLAKYVPGNIFHLAGRQAIGMAADLPAGPLAKSAVWELGLISGTGLLFGVLAIPLSLLVPDVVGMFALIFCVGVTISVLLRYDGPALARTFGWYVGFLAISGALFVAIVGVLVATESSGVGVPWLQLWGAYVLAWMAGLVTPGAPAGVGVREMVLLFLLAGVLVEADLLLAIVLGRVVTVVGDVLYFTAAVSMNGQLRRA